MPFIGAVAGLLGSRWPRGRSRTEENNARAARRAAWLAIVPLPVALVLLGYLVWRTRVGPGLDWPPGTFYADLLPGFRSGAWGVIETGGVPITVGLQIDGLSVLTAILVCVVALGVQVYSVGYLRGDPRYPSYAAFISLFTSAMLLVVFAADLLVLYVGWELMGLCSYLLIGHWWEDRGNSRAAVKAFLVTRLGDVAFLFGIFTLGFAAGSFRIADVLAADLPEGTLVAATLLLLGGVAGKSAQVPLHTWLPDAMAGPTPISALIHAATMVAAGIFIVARLFPIFPQPTLDVLGVLAAVGMLGAALAALAQDDLKRVLAYSTISQLAYMAAALAAGSPGAAIFHLMSHGAFKALLFLCAGAVIHHVGSNLLSHMGGLRRVLPIPFWTMTIGFAALVGLPPTSGFFSKDGVLLALEHSASPIRLLLYGSALITVGVTGAYATRAWLRGFFGEQAPLEPAHGHAAPPTMLWPLVVLTVPTLLFGFLGAGDLALGSAAVTLVVGLLGVAIVLAAWRAAPAADPARLLGPFRAPCEEAFYLDRVYDRLVTRPTMALALLVVRTDTSVVDGAVRGSGQLTLRLSRLVKLAQQGNAQLYVTGLLAGVLLIVVGAVVL
ncbi:NADH-quinone oxidoreductase subunit 5 family protein [Acrocarpospora catenulata]|uniref:NADH-quinone oxidoreductase subunit 5 family protein n=1 Tax=Acrocarpospora catenulata TaxID=2836182 RepID=UPI0027E0E7F5|nr:NADH-quinone oxidoreductase subunit L [Acrocarpospora catenulata]